jgi:hypothetical protein
MSPHQLPKKQRLVIYSGYAVLASIVLMLLSTAFLGGWHPPGYGIINLAVLLLVYPLSVYGSIVGLRTHPDAVLGYARRYFIAVGIRMTSALCATLLFILKFVLGKPL